MATTTPSSSDTATPVDDAITGLGQSQIIPPSRATTKTQPSQLPLETFDAVVLGSGPGAHEAATLLLEAGRSIALVNNDDLANPCTWQDQAGGRALLDIARTVHQLRTCRHPGVTTSVRLNYADLMANVAAEAEDQWENSLSALMEDKRLALRHGQARFISKTTLKLDDQLIKAKQFIVAPMASARIPHISGLDDVPYLTCSSVWDHPAQPEHLLVLGHHSEACEIAQAFARLGTKVTLIRAADQLLPRRDPEAGLVLANVMRREGIHIGALPVGVQARRIPGGVEIAGADGSFTGSHLLVAVGCQPNTASLTLSVAGVTTDHNDRVLVNERLRSTTAEHVYAIGHAVGRNAAVHLATEQAQIAVRNLVWEERTRRIPLPVLDSLPGKWHADKAPKVVFTDPQVAMVGLTEAEAALRYGSKARVAMVPLAAVDRARGAGLTDGFIKLVVAPGLFGSKTMLRLVGMTAVGPDAGEIIAPGTLTIHSNISVSRLASTMAPHGTWAEAVRVAASLFFAPGHGLRDRPATAP